MLNRTKHETTMRNILNGIYTHKDLSPLLGFKGGTACYFFYDLPRFSTDLDFNILNFSDDKKRMVFELLPGVIQKYGDISDKFIKKNTIFFFVTHTEKRSGIKIEISTREIESINNYDLLEFYGTSILVMKKEDIFANKLLALKLRHSATARDLFDINYFFEKNWDINENIIKKVSGLDMTDYLAQLPQFIKNNFNNNTIHLGLGELVADESQRNFVKTKLIDDTINKISFYIDSKKRN